QKRGIKSEVVMDRNAAASTNAKVLEELGNAGIPVRLNTSNGLLHHKFMIIDDKILLNGSANWTYSAFEKNDDCFVIIDDLTKDQIRFLNRLWKNILLDSEDKI